MIADDELMTTLDVAGYLKVSRSKVDELIREKAIPGYRISRRWRCRKSDLLSWLDEQMVTDRGRENNHERGTKTSYFSDRGETGG